MSTDTGHEIYDYLLERAKNSLDPKAFDMYKDSIQITTIQKQLGEEKGILLAEIILSVILHYEKMEKGGSSSFKTRPYDGRPITKDHGLKYETRKLPVMLSRMIFIMVHEIYAKTFPYLEGS